MSLSQRTKTKVHQWQFSCYKTLSRWISSNLRSKIIRYKFSDSADPLDKPSLISYNLTIYNRKIGLFIYGHWPMLIYCPMTLYYWLITCFVLWTLWTLWVSLKLLIKIVKYHNAIPCLKLKYTYQKKHYDCAKLGILDKLR